jgi:tetratricopeptide (TPR) repeat protein
MADYFFLKGVIAKKRGQLSQALEYLYTSVTALSDQLRVGFQFGIRERVYSWLYLTYEELGDYENALKYFEHMICLNFENSFCEMHKKIRFLGNFIRYKIKLNHTADLYNLFDLYFQFKMSLANNSDKSVYDTHAFRNIPAFFLADE